MTDRGTLSLLRVFTEMFIVRHTLTLIPQHLGKLIHDTVQETRWK